MTNQFNMTTEDANDRNREFNFSRFQESVLTKIFSGQITEKEGLEIIRAERLAIWPNLTIIGAR